MNPDSADPGVEHFLRGARTRREADDDSGAEFLPLPQRRELSDQLPARYLIREDDGGAYLTSRETPEIKVRLDRSLSVTAAAARKAPEGTIFLDGAAQGEPFLDHERRVFNLDHHEGVIRRFTLSACEQAMVLVLREIDLRERPWTILANQPDLDTVLAIWVLLNSVHLGKDEPAIRRAAITLVRVEGLIDSQGLELLEFGAVEESELKATLARLDELREVELSAAGSEAAAGAELESLKTQLRMLDRMIYPIDFFEPLLPVEELALAELSPRRIAVVCSCDCGIYEAEPVLKRLYGKRLGIVVLQKSPDAYTLQQIDSFLPGTLKSVYRTLNLIDPAVRSGRSPNRWGGSGEIGGSPRGTGTRLSPGEIAAACGMAFRQPALGERAASAGLALVLGSLFMVLGWAIAALRTGGLPSAAAAPGDLATSGAGVAAAAALFLAALGAGRRPGFYGIRLPSGWSWLWPAPAAALGALLGGAWMPVTGDPLELLRPAGIAALVLLPVAAEVVFRGLVQGLLMERLRTREPARPWLPSWPVLLSGLFFALWSVPLLFSGPWTAVGVLLGGLGALVLGLALGMARERAESLVASLALHYLGVAAVLVAGLL